MNQLKTTSLVLLYIRAYFVYALVFSGITFFYGYLNGVYDPLPPGEARGFYDLIYGLIIYIYAPINTFFIWLMYYSGICKSVLLKFKYLIVEVIFEIGLNLVFSIYAQPKFLPDEIYLLYPLYPYIIILPCFYFINRLLTRKNTKNESPK